MQPKLRLLFAGSDRVQDQNGDRKINASDAIILKLSFKWIGA
jgi:hypothetical protein